MEIREAAENYLEQIFLETKKKDKVRQADICAAMHYSRPTVSIMLRDLRDAGYIRIDDSGYLSLTKKGRTIAENVYERHCVLVAMLTDFGVDEKVAREDACKIEHDLSKESFEKIRARYQKSIAGVNTEDPAE